MKKNKILFFVLCLQVAQMYGSALKQIAIIASRYVTRSKDLLQKYTQESGLQNKVNLVKAEIVKKHIDTKEKFRPTIEELKKKYRFDEVVDESVKKDSMNQKTSIHVHVDGKGGHGLFSGGQSNPSINPGQTNNYYYGKTTFWDVLERTGSKGVALFSATAGGLAVWMLKSNNSVVPDKIIIVQEKTNN
ncbi:MAG: hypothetical protein ACXWL2_02675 [Candidatus Chromulinivorax sp.]